MTGPPSTIHATAVAIQGSGVLLIGPSGCGKSDLALRLIDRGAMLVADDRVIVKAQHGILSAAAPETIKGLIEIRGIGIVAIPYVSDVPLHIVIQLDGTVERFPMEPRVWTYGDIAIPVSQQNAFEPSAPIKVEMFLRQILTVDAAKDGMRHGH